MAEAYEKALAAKAASRRIGALGSAERNAALAAMAQELRRQAAPILAANAQDVQAAQANGVAPSLIDRLMLNESRIEGMARGLEELAGQPDPLGRVLDGSTLSNGLAIQKVTVPMGVVAIVYEARPNVTSDAAGICLKAGNACVLRGGSIAAKSCQAVVDALRCALESCGLPADAVCLLTTPGHTAVEELFGLVGLVDVLIPRGGAGLIRNCVENSKVPVIETGTGNCHVYVHASADQQMALDIIHNAKCQRPGVCNACESILVDEAVAGEFLPRLLKACRAWGVLVHADGVTACAAEGLGLEAGKDWACATEQDWGREYLAFELSCKVVPGLGEAIDHINRYGTGHSECIVCSDYAASQAFLSGVDAAAVYVNASTRFTDGGMFGLGAEIGISTQKLHARGPMGAEALVSTKYLCRGSGQVRP